MTYFFDKLLVLKDQLFWLFWLKLKLTSQLMILKNSKASRSIKLLLFEWKQIWPHILNFCKHFISQAIDCCDLFPLFVSKLPSLIFFLYFHSFLKIFILKVHLITFTHINVVFFELMFKFCDLILSYSSIII